MNYFVTGGTGFIGRFLIQNLCKRNGTIYVLVRKESRHKIDKLIEQCGADKKKIIPINGDLGKKRLGVTPKDMKTLTGKIDHFYHLGAIYDLKADAESQEVANV